jgi:CBS domain-containing protein
MLVKELMTSRVSGLAPKVSAQDAALYMKRACVGMLPVVADGRVIGVVTDRDIALRCCGEGRDPAATVVKDIMTTPVVQCSEGDDIDQAAELMEAHAVRRLVVTGKTQGVVGILSLDDLARKISDAQFSGRVLRRVATARNPCR